jgi:phosphate-selective porin OprO/OprP
MSASFQRTRRLTFSLLVLTLFSLCHQRAPAQQPAPAQPNPEPAPAQPNPDLERRVRDLEEIIRRMEAERNGNAQPAPAPVQPATPGTVEQGSNTASGPAPERPIYPLEREPATPEGAAAAGTDKKPLAGWDDGFFMRSADNKFYLRITGQIQADHRAYIDDIDYTDIDTFFLRRARFGIEANMFQYYEFRFLPDFGQGQAVIQDGYLNVHYVDDFQVEAGKFKQPFSYEQLIQDRFVPTLERSIFDQLVPARDVGLMIHGQKLLGDRLDYAVSVSNGEINGSGDTNDIKDFAGRIAVRPLNDERLWPVFRGLQLGISGTTGKEEEPVNPNTLKTPAGVRFFQFNSTVRADGLRNRYSPEVSYFYGPLGFAAQYFRQDQVLEPSFTGPTSRFLVDVPFKGWYVLATCLLTGEERTTYSQAITPKRNFDPFHPLYDWGAWEVVARVSRLRLGDDVFAPGPTRLADPTLYTLGVTEFTFGFNWYFNRYVRTQFNWEHAKFDSPVRLGPGPAGLLGHQDTLMTRFQIIF